MPHAQDHDTLSLDPIPHHIRRDDHHFAPTVPDVAPSIGIGRKTVGQRNQPQRQSLGRRRVEQFDMVTIASRLSAASGVHSMHNSVAGNRLGQALARSP